MILFTLTILMGLSVLGFGIVFLSAPFLLNEIYGYEFFSPTEVYEDPIDQMAAQMQFACIEERTDNEIVLNNKGLEGMPIVEMTGRDFCDAIMQGLLKSGEGWYVDSVNMDEDGEHVEKVMRR